MEMTGALRRVLPGVVAVCWLLSAPVAQAGWEYLFSEVGDGNGLVDVSMGDERTACAVGIHQPGGAGSNSEPLVLCTADGGASWRAAQIGAGLTMPTSVHLVDGQVGYLTTFELAGFQVRAKVYRTDNSGRDWTEQTLPGQPQGLLMDTFFLDSSTGFTVGAAGAFWTTDGGASWQAGSLPALGAERSVNGLYFTDAQHGWAVGGFPGEDPQDEWSDPVPACCGFILRTSDGGQSFQIAQDGFEGSLQRVWFADAQHGWAVGGGQSGLILHTADGGGNWTPQAVPSGQWGSAEFVADVVFTSPQVGWAVANIGQGNPQVLTTANGGDSWTIDASYTQAFDGLSGFEAFARYSTLLAASFPIEGRGMVCGSNAVLVGYFGAGFCADFDADGHQDEGCGGDDCDDQNPYLHPGAEELCNGLDENCDGVPDESFDFQRDPRNCGECGFNCQPAQVCWDARCTMDCPAELTRCGQECVDPQTDPDHCGGCDQACAFAQAEATCLAGDCRMGACEPGFWDLDGASPNGCEYACTVQGAEECNGLDDDCDGRIDEDLAGCSVPSDGGLADGSSGDGGGNGDSDGTAPGGCGCASSQPATGWLGLWALWLAAGLGRAGWRRAWTNIDK